MKTIETKIQLSTYSAMGLRNVIILRNNEKKKHWRLGLQYPVFNLFTIINNNVLKTYPCNKL